MLIDSHCHLSSFLASNRLSSVLNLAEQRGIWRIITVGTSTEDWETYRKLASDYAGRIYYTAGLHPGHVEEDWESQLDTLE
ncbi:MAG TPA: TatD family hydrolase, partial [Opitutales bacterium]|nr:TatD family hydrolase [Opitutales bacterium]